MRAAATQRQLAQLAGVPRAKMLAYLKGTIPGTASLGWSYRERERRGTERAGRASRHLVARPAVARRKGPDRTHHLARGARLGQRAAAASRSFVDEIRVPHQVRCWLGQRAAAAEEAAGVGEAPLAGGGGGGGGARRHPLLPSEYSEAEVDEKLGLGAAAAGWRVVPRGQQRKDYLSPGGEVYKTLTLALQACSAEAWHMGDAPPPRGGARKLEKLEQGHSRWVQCDRCDKRRSRHTTNRRSAHGQVNVD